MTDHRGHTHTADFGVSLSYTPGPWCSDHRSNQCLHALDAINNMQDTEPISSFLENMEIGTKFELAIPLWPDHFMWEVMRYEVVLNLDLGIQYGMRPERGKHSAFHGALDRVLPGDCILGLTRVLRQQFEDLMDLEWQGPGRGAFSKGCRDSRHIMKYQYQLDELMNEASTYDIVSTQLEPHLYALRARDMCAFCWADAYGNEARRVSGSNNRRSDGFPDDEAVDFGDLLPDDTMTTRRSLRGIASSHSSWPGPDLPF